MWATLCLKSSLLEGQTLNRFAQDEFEYVSASWQISSPLSTGAEEQLYESGAQRFEIPLNAVAMEVTWRSVTEQTLEEFIAHVSVLPLRASLL